jgi:hypothetical protein
MNMLFNITHKDNASLTPRSEEVNVLEFEKNAFIMCAKT